MNFRVAFSEAAARDLEELFDHALQRELDSDTGDLKIPARALQAIQDALVFCRLRRLPAARRAAARLCASWSFRLTARAT